MFRLRTGLARHGDWPRAAAPLTDALAWARRSNDLSRIAMVQTARGELLLFQEDFPAALEALDEAARLLRDGRVITMLLEVLALQAECLVGLDRLEEAGGLVAEARSYLAAPEDWWRLVAAVDLAEGLLRARQGRWPEAEARFSEALEINQALSLRWDEARGYHLWGEAALRCGSRAARQHGQTPLDRAHARWTALGAGAFADLVIPRLD